MQGERERRRCDAQDADHSTAKERAKTSAFVRQLPNFSQYSRLIIRASSSPDVSSVVVTRVRRKDPVLVGRRLDGHHVLMSRKEGGKESGVRSCPLVEKIVRIDLDELEVFVNERVGGLEVYTEGGSEGKVSFDVLLRSTFSCSHQDFDLDPRMREPSTWDSRS